jgi:hypothetical protein
MQDLMGAPGPLNAPLKRVFCCLLLLCLAPLLSHPQRMPVFTPVSDAAPRQLLATPGSAGRSSWTAGSPATK